MRCISQHTSRGIFARTQIAQQKFIEGTPGDQRSELTASTGKTTQKNKVKIVQHRGDNDHGVSDL
jgi:hypothetical protein